MVPSDDVHWRVVLTGCSGGGKSRLLAELARRGYRVLPEAGRQIVREQMQAGGDALPWTDLVRFVDLSVARAMTQYDSVSSDGRPVFFDRSIIDQLSGLEHARLPVPAALTQAAQRSRYARRIFVTPPWQAIFVSDAERPKSFSAAVAEYETLRATYARFGHVAVEVPRLPVTERADFVLAALAAGSA